MGEAKRRGTYEERKAKAIACAEKIAAERVVVKVKQRSRNSKRDLELLATLLTFTSANGPVILK